MNDPFETGVPKYATAQGIYDALCELTQTEEMGILAEMFADVSYDGQEYYYTDKGCMLKEKFEELSDYGNKMWLMDLAVWQSDQAEIHDLVYEALINSDFAKRLGFKKLFIDKMLGGDKSGYDDITEEYLAELGALNRFDNYEMIKAFNRVMQAREKAMYTTPYPNFAYALSEKARNLNLQKEVRLIAECRALLTSYDDFMLGLHMNQALYTRLEGQYKAKVLQLKARDDEIVKQLLLDAADQGVIFEPTEAVKMLFMMQEDANPNRKKLVAKAKYTLSKLPPEKLNCIQLVITADENDDDYLTSVSSYTKEEFDQWIADQVIKLLRDYGGPHGLDKIDYNSGIDIDIPCDEHGKLCHTLENLDITYVDENGYMYKVTMDI